MMLSVDFGVRSLVVVRTLLDQQDGTSDRALSSLFPSRASIDTRVHCDAIWIGVRLPPRARLPVGREASQSRMNVFE